MHHDQGGRGLSEEGDGALVVDRTHVDGVSTAGCRSRSWSPARSVRTRRRPRRRNTGMTSPTNATCPATVHQPSLRARRRARVSREGDSSRITVARGAPGQVGRESVRHRSRGGAAVTEQDDGGWLSGHADRSPATGHRDIGRLAQRNDVALPGEPGHGQRLGRSVGTCLVRPCHGGSRCGTALDERRSKTRSRGCPAGEAPCSSSAVSARGLQLRRGSWPWPGCARGDPALT